MIQKIIIFKEKHGDRCFDATGNNLHKAALKVLSDRQKEGYWYPNIGDLTPPTKPSLSKEQLTTLPLGKAREAGEREWQEYAREKRRFDSEVNIANHIEKAIKEKDGKLALRILEERQDYEYEGMETVTLESTDET